jgi:hypothetical protein
MRWMKISVFLLPAMVVAACADSTGNDTGQARVFMSVSGDAAAAVAAAPVVYLDGAMQSLVLDNVDSLFVRVTGVSVLRSDDDPEGTSGWVYLELEESAYKLINVLNLTNDDTLLIAEGALEAGDYHNLRLEFDSAAIVLASDQTVGSFPFLGGTVYPLQVPSGVVKLPLASFTIGVDAVSTLNLEFREQPSIANITATGSGVLQMSPVLHVK